MDSKKLEAYILEQGKRVFDIEIENLLTTRENLNNSFVSLTKLIMENSGRVIISGMGKSGHIANKIAATLSSLGTPAYYLHPAEGLHGDLGKIQKEDIVLILSNSGETDELLSMIPSIKIIGAHLVGISSKETSTLAKHSNLHIHLPIIKEASIDNLAPTTSTTTQLVFGDALAVILSELKNFQSDDFAVFHPKGALGKKLLMTVKEIMLTQKTKITERDNLKEAIIAMSSEGINGVSIVDENNHVVGIITDGDLRRLLEKSDHSYDLYKVALNSIMVRQPVTINENELAIKALEIMKCEKDAPIIFLPVVNDQNQSVGIIRIHDILKEGIIL